MKYMNIKNVGFVLFPNTISHKSASQLFGQDVISAGFVGIDCDNLLCCYGESETLHKKCLPNDTSLLRLQVKE